MALLGTSAPALTFRLKSPKTASSMNAMPTLLEDVLLDNAFVKIQGVALILISLVAIALEMTAATVTEQYAGMSVFTCPMVKPRSLTATAIV